MTVTVNLVRKDLGELFEKKFLPVLEGGSIDIRDPEREHKENQEEGEHDQEEEDEKQVTQRPITSLFSFIRKARNLFSF